MAWDVTGLFLVIEYDDYMWGSEDSGKDELAFNYCFKLITVHDLKPDKLAQFWSYYIFKWH